MSHFKKSNSLTFFCETCNNGVCDILELNQLINRLLIEVNDLKAKIRPSIIDHIALKSS